MPDDGIMLTLSADEWAWVIVALRRLRDRKNVAASNEVQLTALLDKLADRLDLDLEKLDG